MDEIDSGMPGSCTLHSHIIVAEDDQATLKLFVRQLKEAGYEVTPCINGREALEAIQERGKGIIIADWGMPEMGGLELCQAVRELQSFRAIQSVHIILVTASADKDRLVQGLEAGADDYLTKPYHAQELLARLHAAERTLRLLDELFQQRMEVQKANATLQVFNDKLEKLASTDMLTGLHNRRVLFERFGELWAMSERTDADLAFIMLDIDHFKSVNDTYGHHVGDLVLTEVSRRMRGALRPYDVCARFGGEEFAVVCPNSDSAATTQIAERIRQAVAAKPVKAEDQVIPVTVSVGAATRREDHASVDVLIGEADEMLYRAKENGRNQVWYYDAAGQPTPYPQAVTAT